jgi:hypothetical protein
MLTVQQLAVATKQGDSAIRSLIPEEEGVLQGYMLMLTQQGIKQFVAQNVSAEDIILNSIRVGMSLGLSIQIQNRAVVGRGAL